MSGQLITFNGFGSFRGFYSANPGAATGDVVLSYLSRGGQQLRTVVTSVAVNILATGPNANVTGWFADWMILAGDPSGIVNQFALGPFSGVKIGPNSFQVGTGGPANVLGLVPTVGVGAAVRTELASGRVYIPAYVAAAPFAPPPTNFQMLYTDLTTAPQTDNGEVCTFLLLPPTPVGLAGASTQVNFAFQVDVQGKVAREIAQPVLPGMQGTRPLPQRSS